MISIMFMVIILLGLNVWLLLKKVHLVREIELMLVLLNFQFVWLILLGFWRRRFSFLWSKDCLEFYCWWWSFFLVCVLLVCYVYIYICVVSSDYIFRLGGWLGNSKGGFKLYGTIPWLGVILFSLVLNFKGVINFVV